jgi:catechol 2,3-dioxygenase-like lactoylglutathione lyase family enzyme
MTVPTLDEAIRFFEDALGGLLLWRVGPFHETATGVPINSVQIAILRLGPSLNVELLEFDANQQDREMPSNVDMGAGHIAFFVEDIRAATESLRNHGAELLQGPLEGAGEEKKGEKIWYFKTPWGAFMEIQWRPDHLPYEQKTENRLFNQKDPWSNRSVTQSILSAKHVDHVGMVVPDLDAAVRFFDDAFGARVLWRVGPFQKTPTGVPIKKVVLAMLRLGPNLNVELQAFEAEQQQKRLPSNIDFGATYLAFFVDDLQTAASSLESHGAEFLRGPIETAGDAKKGERIWYFKTPWGSLMEILWRPDHLAYEETTENRLFQPKDAWFDQI